MKALSLWQPWATAIALGLKRIETRHWATDYRGPLVIHAAKRWTAEEREFAIAMAEEYDLRLLEPPLGAIVAVCRLASIRPTEQLRRGLSACEEDWGNYGPGRFGWMLEDIEPLPEPIPFKGLQGLFDVPADILSGGGYSVRNGATSAPPRQGVLL